MYVIPAKIMRMSDFLGARNGGVMVCASGGFDPIHPGHTSYLIAAANLGDSLVVLVNDDAFLSRKKGRAFMPIADRCQVVASIRGVDYVVPFSPSDPSDDTVCEALELIHPGVFAKGGDRTDASSIPEWDTCARNSIKIETGVGWSKEWSSSDYLKKWRQL